MGVTKITIDDLKALARKRGGECLSDTYVNAHTKYLWRCEFGHEWEATSDSVKNGGKWCPSCAHETSAKKRRLRLEDFQLIAENRGGECLSSVYKNINEKLRWRCEYGHEWEASADSVKNAGRWCPTCGYASSARKRGLGLEALHEIATSRGGECLATEYTNSKTKVRWRCELGHEWEACPDHVKGSESWCPECAMERIVAGHQERRLGLQAMRALAESRGGQCLSGEYVSRGKKLLWKCENGHKWEAVPDSVISGTWCPYCGAGARERVCRAIFEMTLGVPFPKKRPHWLTNKSGNRMELDGYSSDISVAFEHHGHQHYKYCSFFHSAHDDLRKRQSDDIRKAGLCREHGVILFEIPYTVPVDELQSYIISMIDQYNSDASNSRKIKISNRHIVEISELEASSPKYLSEMKEIATSRGGSCLSSVYINAWSPLLWRCQKGHSWSSVPAQVKNMGQWCPECAKEDRRLNQPRRQTIEDMRSLGLKMGGKCLSEEYGNANTKLEWECAKGHRWMATPSAVKNLGTWCPACAELKKVEQAKKRRLGIDLMRTIAIERGGKCLSEDYVNTYTKLHWQCSEGHEWHAVPKNIMKGAWCPTCGNKRKGQYRKRTAK